MEDDEEYRNWAELPPELLSKILHRLGAIEILENAQKVCRSWRHVCRDPSMWRVIDMLNHGYSEYGYLCLDTMCCCAVDLSQGGLVEIDLWDVGSDDILKYIADRSSNLKSLISRSCSRITNEGFVEAVVKLPRLEDLEVSWCWLSGVSLKVLGQSCPNLKTLKVNRRARNENDDDALSIAETMPGLHHLQLCGNGLSDTGLKSILDNCPNLEHLDIRRCFNVNLVGDLQKQCYERVKVVRHPGDSTHDYPFGLSYCYMDSSDDEYGYDYDDRIDMNEEYDGFGEYPLYDYDQFQ